MLLGFKRQFAAVVSDGSKTHTIRAARKATPKVGEIAHCYVDPRQKTMRLLGRWRVVRVQTIKLDASTPPDLLIIRIDGVRLSRDEAEALLYRDGFRDRGGERYEATAQARTFWECRLPFVGVLIHWDYAAAAAPPIHKRAPEKEPRPRVPHRRRSRAALRRDR